MNVRQTAARIARLLDRTLEPIMRQTMGLLGGLTFGLFWGLMFGILWPPAGLFVGVLAFLCGWWGMVQHYDAQPKAHRWWHED